MIFTECCEAENNGERFCPKCGWECRLAERPIEPSNEQSQEKP